MPKKMKAFSSKSFYQFEDNESKFCRKKKNIFFINTFAENKCQ